MLKRFLMILLALALLTGCASAETAAETGAAAIESKAYTVYAFKPDTQWEKEFPLYFLDGVQDLPYAELSDWAELMNYAFQKVYAELQYQDYKVTCEIPEENIVCFTRENGSTMIFNFTDGTIFFHDYMQFLLSGNGRYLDMSSIPDTDPEGRPYLLQAVSTRDRCGADTILNLKDYEIPMLVRDGKYLVPMQTLSAFCFSPYQFALFFNGQALFLAANSTMKDPSYLFMVNLLQSGLVTQEELMQMLASGGGTDGAQTQILEKLTQSEEGRAFIAKFREDTQKSLYPLYANAPKAQRSDALASYGYWELCLELDTFYGLKDVHEITDFNTFFLQTGLVEPLCDPDALKADGAIGALTQYWLDDGHSGFGAPSYLSAGNPQLTEGISGSGRSALNTRISAARRKYSEASLGYYEVGDTAYVTFDIFKLTEDNGKFADYYDLDAKGTLPEDTIGIIVKAHREITRENSPIKNVVLDLSCNGGGMAPAALYTLGWFLGDAQVSVRNTSTGGESTEVYKVDVNLDHEFTEDDTLAGRGLNLYCLTSPLSFSCGNLVPWAFKANGSVTLLGRITGGGSCAVQPMSTAWGTNYQISGFRQISFLKNGAYYDVDRGVEPDYIINDYDNFYNRKVLTEFINGLI